MNHNEWNNHITSLFNYLKSKPMGLKLYNRLEYFLIKKELIISNKKNDDNLNNYIYVPSQIFTYKIPYLIEPLTYIEGDTNEMKSIHKLTEQIYIYKETNISPNIRPLYFIYNDFKIKFNIVLPYLSVILLSYILYYYLF
jgi:hypothetical protein